MSKSLSTSRAAMLPRRTTGAVAALVGCGLALSACGAPPAAQHQASGAAQPGGSGTSPAAPGQQTPAQPAPATPDPTALQPGTNHDVAAAAYTYPAAKVQQWAQLGAKAPDYPNKKIAFLTFDDGPTTALTPKDLDVLKANGVHATFYLITKQLDDKTIPITKRALAEGNSLDVHSRSHDYNYLYPGRTCSADHVASDYDRGEQQLKQVFGPDFVNHGVRYPGGHMSWKKMAPCDQVLADRGLAWVDWNSMTGDAEPPKTHPTTPDGMVQMVASEAKAANDNVTVVLMHDAADKSMTNQALPGVINWFKQQGYEFGVID